MHRIFDTEAFAADLRHYRRQHDVSLSDASSTLGINHRSLYDIETEGVTPSINSIIKICDWMVHPITEYIREER